MRSGDRVRSGRKEVRGAYPHVIILKKRNGIPFPMQKDMQDMHDVVRIGGDFACLVRPFAADWVWTGALLVIRLFIRSAAVLSLELLNAVSISLQLVGNLGFVELPRVSLAESGVVLLGIEVDNIAKNSHQWEEETKDIVSVTVST
jgi:hypothetical protein